MIFIQPCQSHLAGRVTKWSALNNFNPFSSIVMPGRNGIANPTTPTATQEYPAMRLAWTPSQDFLGAAFVP